jgi:hypothetical protein
MKVQIFLEDKTQDLWRRHYKTVANGFVLTIKLDRPTN